MQGILTLWEGIMKGDPATDHIVALLVLASIGFGIGAVLLFDEARRRRRS